MIREHEAAATIMTPTAAGGVFAATVQRRKVRMQPGRYVHSVGRIMMVEYINL